MTQESAKRDEVDRCRQVRRRLEQQHGGLSGLSDWLATLQERHDRNSRRERKRTQSAGKKRA